MSLMATVAGDLRAVVAMHERLLAEAVHSANDPLMPGGKSMVELGPVANLETWANLIDGLERRWLDYYGLPGEDMPNWAENEDDTWEPPLQTLLFWSESWRHERGYPLEGRRPTIATEASFLRHSVEWAWDHEPHFEDFAKDVAAARRCVEDTLHEGDRAERGAPCLYETCNGARLTRRLKPTRDKDGAKVWVHTDWKCRRCGSSWTEDRYAAMVTAAHEATKIEEVSGEMWCSVDYAARKVDRSVKTIRTWIDRSELVALCMIAGRRLPFVNLDDVRELSELKNRRQGQSVESQ